MGDNTIYDTKVPYNFKIPPCESNLYAGEKPTLKCLRAQSPTNMMAKSIKIPQVSSSQRKGTFKSKDINGFISNFVLFQKSLFKFDFHPCQEMALSSMRTPEFSKATELPSMIPVLRGR